MMGISFSDLLERGVLMNARGMQFAFASLIEYIDI